MSFSGMSPQCRFNRQNALDGFIIILCAKNRTIINQPRELAVFAKTVELRSFRLAAQELKLSLSVVSHHSSQREEQLGVALLYRSRAMVSCLLVLRGKSWLLLSAVSVLSETMSRG